MSNPDCSDDTPADEITQCEQCHRTQGLTRWRLKRSEWAGWYCMWHAPGPREEAFTLVCGDVDAWTERASNAPWQTNG